MKTSAYHSAAAFASVVAVLEQVLRDLAGHAGARDDQPLVVLGQELAVHARLAVEALGVGEGGELDEVLVAREVAGEEDEVEVVLLARRSPGCGARRSPGATYASMPMIGLRPRLLRLLLELPRRVQVAVIGDREGRLLELLGPADQVVDPVRAVQQRVLGVAVEMDEGHGPVRIASGRSRCIFRDASECATHRGNGRLKLRWGGIGLVLLAIVGGAALLVVATPLGRYLARGGVGGDEDPPCAAADRAARARLDGGAGDARQARSSCSRRATSPRTRCGLPAKDAFTQFTQLERDTLLLVLSGARKDWLEPKTWWFPVVGRVPYKGYFDLDDALRAERDLVDGRLRRVRAAGGGVQHAGLVQRPAALDDAASRTRWSS